MHKNALEKRNLKKKEKKKGEQKKKKILGHVVKNVVAL